jgi:hypothetical protein
MHAVAETLGDAIKTYAVAIKTLNENLVICPCSSAQTEQQLGFRFYGSLESQTASLSPPGRAG